MKQLKIILIVGMHRSGTSIFSNLMWQSGFALGKNIDRAPKISNETGHWEHKEITNIQESLLTLLLGAYWNRADEIDLPQDWLSWPETQAAKAQLVDLIKKESTDNKPLLIKDPRTTLLLPLWYEIGTELNASLSIIACLRDPNQIAASLKKRDNVHYEDSIRIWLRHYQSLLRDTECSFYTVRYEELLKNGINVLKNAISFCGEPYNKTILNNAIKTINPALNHHSKDATEDKLPAEAESMYKLLTSNDCHWVSFESVQAHKEYIYNTIKKELSDRVQIIIRTNWRMNFLQRAIRSILAQTHTNWRIYIINDGGADHLIKKTITPYREMLRNKLTIRNLHPAVGMEEATNTAIRMGNEPFICIHDDDDTWHPYFLEKILHLLKRSTHYSAVTNKNEIYESEKNQYREDRSHPCIFPFKNITLHRLKLANPFQPICLMFKRAAIDKIGLFNCKLPVCGDWDFHLRLAQLENIPIIPLRLANYHKRHLSDAIANSSRELQIRFKPAVDCFTDRIQQKHIIDSMIDAAVLYKKNSLLGTQLLSNKVELERKSKTSSNIIRRGINSSISYSIKNNLILSGFYILSINMKNDTPLHGLKVYFTECGEFTEKNAYELQHDTEDKCLLILNCNKGLTNIGLQNFAQENRAGLAEIALYRICPPIDESGIKKGLGRMPNVICGLDDKQRLAPLLNNLENDRDIWITPTKGINYFPLSPAMNGVEEAETEKSLTLLLTADKMLDRYWAKEFLFSSFFPLQWYSRLFDITPPNKIIVDFIAPWFTLTDAEICRLSGTMPEEAKVLLMLTHPTTTSCNPASAEEALELLASHQEKYKIHIESIHQFRNHFSKERVHICFYNGLERNNHLIKDATLQLFVNTKSCAEAQE